MNKTIEQKTIALHYNQGMSLVELMIALALSLFLAGGVIKIYVSNSTSQEVQQVVGEMQENQRSALAFLAEDLRSAGSTNTSLSIIDTVNTAEGGISGLGVPLSDTISINRHSLDPDPNVVATDCMGRADQDLDGDKTVTNTYYINANGSLLCRGSGNAIPEPIAEGIENMQILYGVDTDPIVPGVIRSANVYLNATQVATANAFGNVVSVRIALLFKSDQSINSAVHATSYDLLGTTYTPVTSSNRHRRQVVTTTISFRNAG